MFPMGGWGATASGNALPPPEKKEQNSELENILGNYLVAKYQVMRLENKLAYIARTCPDSTFMFKGEGDWFKVSLNVVKQEEPKKEEDLEKAFENAP